MTVLILLFVVCIVIYGVRVSGEIQKLDHKLDKLIALVERQQGIEVVSKQEAEPLLRSDNAGHSPDQESTLEQESDEKFLHRREESVEFVDRQESVGHAVDQNTSDDVFVDHTLENPSAQRPAAIPGADYATMPQNASAGFHASSSSDVVSKDSLTVEKFFVWLKHDWPLKIGGLLIILAAGWFITYAAAEGWLSEAARVVIGYVFGVVALIYGTLRAPRVRLQGNIFLLIGIAVVFVSTIAAVNFASVLMPSALALGVMLITVAFVSLVSLKQKSQSLTGFMIAFGAFVPLAFFQNGLAAHFIFAYLFVLTLGTLWIVYKTSWRKLTALMLGVVAFYSIGHAIDVGNAQNWTNMILALAFGAVFYGANVSAIISRAKNNDVTGLSTVDYLTAIGVTLMYLVWVYLFGPTDYKVILLLLGVALFVGASYGIFSMTRVQAPTIIYGAAAFILIVVATAEVANGAVLITAYIVEVAVAIALLIYARGERLTSQQQMVGVVLFSLPLLMLIDSISKGFSYISSRGSGVLSRSFLDFSDIVPHLFAIFVAVLSSFILALLVRLNVNLTQESNRLFLRFFATIGLILSIVLVWLMTHTFLENFDVATFVSLFIYTAVGAYFYVLGARAQYKPYQVIGVALFGIVLLDIFLVEFWEMSQAMRIITAFVVGVVFIITAYIARSRGEKDV